MDLPYTPISAETNTDPDKTDRFMVFCPECQHDITCIRACPPLELQAYERYRHLCVYASGMWRWCGTFGSLHIEVYKVFELKQIFFGETNK